MNEYETVPVHSIQINQSLIKGERDKSTGGSKKFQPTTNRSKSFISKFGFAGENNQQ